MLTALAATVAGLSTLAAPQAQSQWVYPGPDGQLVYKALPTGDKIMDFSHAGYRAGQGNVFQAIEWSVVVGSHARTR